jgi:hypothetical protein
MVSGKKAIVSSPDASPVKSTKKLEDTPGRVGVQQVDDSGVTTAMSDMMPLFQPAGDCNPECILPISIETICDRFAPNPGTTAPDAIRASIRSTATLMFECIGILLGHSLRNGCPMGVYLPPIVWAMLTGETVFNWLDYCCSDAQLIRSCASILEAPDAQDLMLTFEGTQSIWKSNVARVGAVENAATGDDAPPGAPSLTRAPSSSVYVAVEKVSVELIPGGADTVVNNANRNKFVKLLAKMHCLNGCEDSIAAIRRGFVF